MKSCSAKSLSNTSFPPSQPGISTTATLKNENNRQLAKFAVSQHTTAPTSMVGMSDEYEFIRPRTVSIRLPEKLVADLRRIAAQEANTQSAVARRLISTGLSREIAEAGKTKQSR